MLAQLERGWMAQVSYGRELTDQAWWPLTIFVCDAQTGERVATGEPNTTVDGYPVRAGTYPYGVAYLEVLDLNGIYVEMQTPDLTYAASDGLVSLFRATQFFPDPADCCSCSRVGQCRKRTEERAMSTVNFQLS